MVFQRISTGPGAKLCPFTVARVPAGPDPGSIDPSHACEVHAHAKLAAAIMRTAPAPNAVMDLLARN